MSMTRTARTEERCGHTQTDRQVADLQQLVHELQTRQTELVRHNEELQRAQQELTAARDRAEAARQESELGYRTLFENAADPIALFRLDGTFSALNRAAERLLGWPRTKLIGQHFRTVVTPASAALADERTRQFLAGEKVAAPMFEAELVCADGRAVPVEAHTRTIRDQHGKPIGFQGIYRDITERKRIAAALQREVRISQGQTAALAHMLRALTAVPDLDTFLGQVLTAIAQQLELATVSLWLFDDTQDKLLLQIRYEQGQIQSAPQDPDGTAVDPPLSLDSPVWRELFHTRRPLVIETAEQEPCLNARESVLAQAGQPLLLVPLVLADAVIGVLSLRPPVPRVYRPEEIALAQALSMQATLAIQLAGLAEHAQQVAVLEERNRLAREIHDTLAQGFTGITLHLEVAKRVLTTAPDKTLIHLAEAYDLARESLTEARRSVMALRPQTLERDALPTALSRLATHPVIKTSARISVNVHKTVCVLPAEVEHNLLRIAQEALSNAAKHAQAETIRLDLTYGVRRVRLSVQDNGLGFDVHGPPTGSGFGLTSMRERVEQIGGHFHLSSRPGRGTQVVVSVPTAGLVSRPRKHERAPLYTSPHRG